MQLQRPSVYLFLFCYFFVKWHILARFVNYTEYISLIIVRFNYYSSSYSTMHDYQTRAYIETFWLLLGSKREDCSCLSPQWRGRALATFLLLSSMTLVAQDTSEIGGGWSAGGGHIMQAAGYRT